MIESLFAIDPGACSGWALFHRLGTVWYLAAAGIATPDTLRSPLKDPDLVIIEDPEIYPNSKARPSNILTLAKVVGRYQERFRTSAQRLVHPHAWKGSIDGDIFCKRIEASLTDKDRAAMEKCPASKVNNILDAIGLGRWSLTQPWSRDKILPQ
jgi:hypothetical protein